ncbi:MAG: UxaA family hydrolase [Anaerolineae bacterium]|nr:UxaA family hydrolase [Anaerolineae bacterium]
MSFQERPSAVIPLTKIGRLPAESDNCAIATRTLRAGTAVARDNAHFTLSHTILEGHRFAVRRIAAGEPLLSWEFPFGVALRDIAPGEYVCNAAVLAELHSRALPFTLPAAPNFADQSATYTFDEAHFAPASPLRRYAETRTFLGYPRPGKRGVGTRNRIVLLGTSSLTAAFVRRLEERLRPLAAAYPHVDGIVAVAHTEGGTHTEGGSLANNRELLLRTLAVDSGNETVGNGDLQGYMADHGYALADVPHHFFPLFGTFTDDLERAAAIVTGWLQMVNGMTRTAVPLSHLKIALQCGGSDAFSGISGNPLAAWLAKEVLHHGGSANLAETDELVGAEAYALAKVRDAATARRFLHTLARFQAWAGWHGHMATENPSGGNLYRGLYNIYLKSLGAATKRHPDVPLDFVIEYGAPMTEPGYYFMDSPGNDLESIAGQVASGCNLIFFITGNGSITNFPFVPTVKIVTTSQRYDLLAAEMDVNAGAYLDGRPLDELGRESLELVIQIASGQPSTGEIAGHAQVQIWRNWPLAGPLQPASSPDNLRLSLSASIAGPSQLHGRPHPIHPADSLPNAPFAAWQTPHGPASDQVGLILPTSLCAGQIARLCAQQLQPLGVTRLVALPHTEGCGSSTEAEFVNVMLGYATHPLVRHCLLLEHGCEKTHNAYWRQQLARAGIDPHPFGWASIQLDGGIQAVLAKMAAWFADRTAVTEPLVRIPANLGSVRLGLVTDGHVSETASATLARLVQWLVSAGGTVVLPTHDSLFHQNAFLRPLGLPSAPSPTLAFAQRPAQAGCHIMQTPSTHWTETLTGLGATGVEVVLALVGARPLPGHPLIPLLQVAEAQTNPATDVDVVLSGPDDLWAGQLLDMLLNTLSQEIVPVATWHGNVDFQITRGVTGVSL